MNEVMTADKERGSKLEVKQSSIPGAGMGLFARMNHKAGTIVSFYPVHGLRVDFVESSICIGSDSIDQEYFSNHDSRKSNYVDYLMGTRPLLTANITNDFGGDVLFVDINPNRPVTPGWMSRLVNDGAVVEIKNENGVLNYYAQTRRVKSCVHVPFGPSQS